jgi:hypothetical protein
MYAQRVAAQNQQSPGYGNAWQKLSSKILEHGGVAVVPPLGCEFQLRDILRRGVLQSAPARLTRGEISQCHRNTAVLFKMGKTIAIVTGYALSDDGLWRQHTWGLDKRGTVIETTERRAAYFGFALNEDESEAFVDNELD